MEKYSGMIIHNIIYIIGYKNDLVSYFFNKKKSMGILGKHLCCLYSTNYRETTQKGQVLRNVVQKFIPTSSTGCPRAKCFFKFGSERKKYTN